MVKYTGKSVYGALAMGRIAVFEKQEIPVKRIHIDSVEEELKRVERAKKEASEQLREIYDKAFIEVGEDHAKIFEIHIMLIEDNYYNSSIRNIIETQRVNAEYAIAVTSDNFSHMFSKMEDTYMQARAADVKDISDRLISNLTGKTEKSIIMEENLIICADDLVPSQTAKLDKNKVLAFVTAHGSSHSHTAILAKNMNIPAIVGLGKEFLAAAAGGVYAIVDGYMGDVYIDPDRETIEKYIQKKKSEEERQRLLEELRDKKNFTSNGIAMNVCANIDSPDNIGAVIYNGADGIGLFRSEYLYLKSDIPPSEEEQFRIYKRIAESMAGKKVIIRTFDIGADKKVDYLAMSDEENPALGCRGIRFCLNNPELFKTQLKAAYRASAYGRIGIMFPMITSASEFKRALEYCEAVKSELNSQGIIYSPHVELGTMIETPAAALISDSLAQLADFFSVGTNDLIQYTLACDRQNPDIEPFLDEHHEAVLSLIEMSAQNAHKHGKRISICGDLAGDTSLTEAFLKMGIDELSVPPSLVLKLRDVIRKIELNKDES